jgi:hypothetical protein
VTGALNAYDGVTNASASTNEEMVMAERTREVLTLMMMGWNKEEQRQVFVPECGGVWRV